MPLDEEVPFDISPDLKTALKPGPERGDFWQRLGSQAAAAFSRENMIGSALNYQAPPDQRVATDDPLRAALFNPEDYLTDTEKAYAQRFAGANSPDDVAHIRKEIEREQVMRGSLRDGPLPEWLAATLAGVADPTTFLPVVGPLTKAGRAAGAVSGAIGVGLSTAAGVGIQESVLQGTQYSRTSEESAGNIIGGLIFGGVIGTAAGAILGRSVAKVDGIGSKVLDDVSTQVAQTIRAAGLGDMPIPRASLLDTTAVGRFLDAPTTPAVKINRSPITALADHDILNVVHDHNPKVLARNTELMTELDAVSKQIDRLSNDPTLFVRNADIRDKPTLDLIEALRKEGTPDALARIAQIEEGARPSVTLEKLLTRQDELYAEWAASEARLAKIVEKTKKELGELGQLLGAKSYAEANGDIARLYQAMKDEIAAGKDPLKLYPQSGSPMDWLKGFAEYPGQRLQEAKKPEPKGKAAEPETKPVDEEARAKVDENRPESVGAAAVESRPAEILSRLRGTLGLAKVSAALKKIGLAAPSIELAMSRFEASRKAIQLLANSGMVTEGHWAGVRGPDDFATEVKALGTPQMIQLQRIVEAAWVDQKRAVQQGAEKMSKLDFYNAIGDAMTAGDKHPNTRVQAAAVELRKIDKHFADLAKEWKVGVFKNPEAATEKMLKTAQSHLLRRYNAVAISSDLAGFQALVKDWFLRTHKGDVNAVKDLADEVAESVTNKILGHPEGRAVDPKEVKVSEGRGSAKERTFLIPDDWSTIDGKYKLSDFTDRNVVNVMAQYIRTMSADIAYQKIIGGDEGLKVIRDDLRFEAQEMMKALPTEKQRLAVAKDLEREDRVIQELIHRIRGTDPHPANPNYAGLKRVSKMARDYNVVRMMGSSLASQLPDMGAMVMSEGLMRTFGSAIGDFVDGFKLLRIGVKEAQRLGTADDMMMGGRMGAIADLSEQYTRQSKAEIISGAAAHKALMLFGVSPWTVIAKGRMSYLGADSILRGVVALAEGGKISDAQRARLAANGIGPEEAKLIYAERSKWDENRGFLQPQVEDWKNQEAANIMSRALLRRIDNAVISPTAADRPLWTQSEVGKAISQFQAFGWAANQRVLLAGLQYRDWDTLMAMTAMVGLGISATAMRDLVSKGEVDKKRSTAAWVREGIDRSGVLSRFMEYDNIAYKTTGFGVARSLTGEQASRYASSGLLERIAGPTAATAMDISNAAKGAITGDLTGTDVHALRRLGPLQNWFPLTGALDRLEQSLVENYGLKPRPQPR